MRTAYKCRAYPDPEQAAILSRTFGCVRLVWNKALAARQAAYRTEGCTTSYRQTDAALTRWKADPELSFLNEVSSVLERKARQLARYQRRMARKQPGSNNRKKAGRRVACAHRKVRNARNDFLHRTSTRLVREYDAIAIENLNVSGMIRNRRLARVIADCGWRRFRSMLEYKAERYGRRLMVVDRYYPSSKTCSICGYLLAELKLSVRAWTCPACGARHDRDINAAKNILAAGRAVAACGADVRRQGDSLPQSAPKQETHSARSGIPLRN
jgi:putative transposase